ncbi:replication initiation protein [Burkholderia cepacia]|uniref:replication initiation protein n=1 Tax=Burkholderia cepacia TaxID=292 RepID=UPI003B56CD2E
MNSCNRLDSVAPDLAKIGKLLAPEQRKAVACRVAEWACRTTDVKPHLSDDRLKVLSDPSSNTTTEDRQSISNDVSEFDERYFEIVEKNNGLDDAGEAMKWFRKARALASLSYAFDASSIGYFCESLYEAQAATDDLSALRELCSRDI